MVGAFDRPPAADLREGATRQRHGGGKISELVVTRLISVADVVVSVDILGPEDSRVDLGQVVWASACDNCSFNAECRSVTAEIACNDGYLAVSSDEGRQGKPADDDLSVHSGYWMLLFMVASNANKVMNSDLNSE